MVPNPSNSSNLEQLALNGLIRVYFSPLALREYTSPIFVRPVTFHVGGTQANCTIDTYRVAIYDALKNNNSANSSSIFSLYLLQLNGLHQLLAGDGADPLTSIAIK